MSWTTASRNTLLAALATVCLLLVSTASATDPGCKTHGRRGGRLARKHCPTCQPRQQGSPDLFYNFSVGGNCGSVTAGLYPAPMPTPPVIGHVFYTYQPFLPHEYLYAHRRRYVQKYDGRRGRNVTTVRYQR